MALSSAFRERLEHMEHTRNQRLSLLQAEKEVQVNNSKDLASKLANIRAMEQRCLLLDQKIASQNFKISTLKSEIDTFYDQYDTISQQVRVLKCEMEELEEVENEKNRYYESKQLEMVEFRELVERSLAENRMRVQELRNSLNELKSTFVELQGNNGNLSNSEIAAAETRKAELLAVKENLMTSLASNDQIRAHLENQLHNMLTQSGEIKG